MTTEEESWGISQKTLKPYSPIEALTSVVGPWAEAKHPEKWAQTLEQQHKTETFRKFLIRLLEIRWAEEPGDWRRDIPLWALEESAITGRLRHPALGILELAGKKVPGRTFGWIELATFSPETLAAQKSLREQFDLEIVELSQPPAT